MYYKLDIKKKKKKVPTAAVVVEHRGWCHWHVEVEQVMIEARLCGCSHDPPRWTGAGVSTRFMWGVEAKPALKRSGEA